MTKALLELESIVPNYSLDDLEGRAKEARLAHAPYVDGLLKKYEERQKFRYQNNLPSVGFCGMGRAGKDTAAEYICAHTAARYPKSASWQILPLVATMIGIPPELAWETRHKHREFWIAACHALRNPDYSLLVRMCLGAGDVAVGIRGKLELEDVVRKGLVDFTVWIENPRVPADITVEYGMDDCDLVVVNSGSLLQFYTRLDKILGILRRGFFSSTERQ